MTSAALSSLGLALGVVCVAFFCSRRRLSFYILFELSLLPTLAMVVLYGYQPEKLRAGGHLLLYTALRSLPLLLTLIGLPPWFAAWGEALVPGGVGALALTVAFIVKSPIYGVHLWLPKAHVEAPVVGSMALAGILLKLGSFGLFLVLPHVIRSVFVVYFLLRVWGSVSCGALCLRQWDLKRLVAYRSVVHMGVVGVGLYLGGEIGRGTALIIVVAHGVCSPIIFRYAFYLYQTTHSRLLSRCRGGLAGPVIRCLFFLLIAVNIGVPPFVNLWREVIMFTALLPLWTGAWPAVGAAAFLGVAYGLFAFVRVTHGKESSDSRDVPRVHAHACRVISSLVLICDLGYFIYLPF